MIDICQYHGIPSRQFSNNHDNGHVRYVEPLFIVECGLQKSVLGINMQEWYPVQNIYIFVIL